MWQDATKTPTNLVECRTALMPTYTLSRPLNTTAGDILAYSSYDSALET